MSFKLSRRQQLSNKTTKVTTNKDQAVWCLLWPGLISKVSLIENLSQKVETRKSPTLSVCWLIFHMVKKLDWYFQKAFFLLPDCVTTQGGATVSSHSDCMPWVKHTNTMKGHVLEDSILFLTLCNFEGDEPNPCYGCADSCWVFAPNASFTLRLIPSPCSPRPTLKLQTWRGSLS